MWCGVVRMNPFTTGVQFQVVCCVAVSNTMRAIVAKTTAWIGGISPKDYIYSPLYFILHSTLVLYMYIYGT